MLFTIFQILAFFSYSCALNMDRYRAHRSLARQNSNVNRSMLYDPIQITKRSDPKYVFMHHVRSIPYILHVYLM